MGVKVKEHKSAWWLFIDYKGKRKAKRVGVGPSGKKAALAAKSTIEARLALGDMEVLAEGDEAAVPTLEQAARRWFATYCQLGQLRISTQALYLSNLERYVFPRFGA